MKETETLGERINELRQEIDKLNELMYPMARLLRNTDGLFPSAWGGKAADLLLKLRSLNQGRYDKEVID